MGYKDDFRRIERMAGRLHELEGFADVIYRDADRLDEAGLLLRHKGGAFGAITVGEPDGRRYPDWQEPCIQWEQYSRRHGKFWKVDEDDRPLGRGMFGQRLR